MADSKAIETEMRKHLDSLAKPRGSLGKLENLALKMANIQGRVPPAPGKKGIYVFAGDHGILEEGVSLYPREATRQVALNILRGGAGINAIGAGAGWDITLVDAGIADDLPADAEKDAKCRLVRAKIAPGSRNCTKGPALTEEELEKALARGEELAGDAADQGYGIVGIGTFGAGVSSTTGALLSAAGFIADDMIDQGAGIDDAKLAHKREIIKQAVKGRKLDAFDGEELLRNFGSPDFAMMAGFMSGLEDRGIACVLDGFPAAAAAWAAWLISPKITKFLFAGHLSKSPGHKIILEHLMLDPIVNLEISLGEGVGAAIGGQILELACLSALNMATSASAGIPGGGL